MMLFHCVALSSFLKVSTGTALRSYLEMSVAGLLEVIGLLMELVLVAVMVLISKWTILWSDIGCMSLVVHLENW